MPRGRSPQSYDGPSDDDLAEFMAILGPVANASVSFDLASGSLGQLLEEITAKGYACRFAPYAAGKGRSLTLYLSDTRKPEVSGTEPEKFEDEVRRMILAVRKLPQKRG